MTTTSCDDPIGMWAPRVDKVWLEEQEEQLDKFRLRHLVDEVQELKQRIAVLETKQ